MSSPKLWKTSIIKISQFLLIFILITVWIFSGWPQIWNNPPFPPKIQQAQATSTGDVFATSNFADGFLIAWTDRTYAYNDDGVQYATRVGTTKNQWYGTLYGFDLSGIPDGATINSVTITAEWKNSADDTAGPVLYLGAKSGGVEVGTATSDTSGQTTFELVTNSPTGLTAANLKATGVSGFLAILRFRRTDNTQHTASVDYVKVAVDYTPGVVDTPAYDNGTATYNNDVSVTITVASPASSTICYTTDGSTPAATIPGTCSTGTTYSGPVSITATGTALKAIGTKSGYTNSAVQSATYTLTVGAITSSPGAGTYTSTQSVTLNIATTTGAVAHYTTNGDAVTCSSTTYSGAFNVSTTTTVKAIGCKTNYNDDTAISDLYTITVYSVTVDITSVGYGTMAINTTNASATITATVGDSATKLNIKGTNATYTEGGKCGDGVCIWTLSTALGEDQYVHGFTKDTALASGGALGSDPATQWVALTTANQLLAASVTANGSQTFKLDMRTPSSAGTETNLGSQYSTDVTIVASAP